MKNVQDRLNQINFENKIWIVYLIIIGLSYYANYYEKDYFLNNNESSKNKYRVINTFIFTMLTLIYLYFEKEAIYSLMNTNPSRKKNDILSLIASSLVLLSGIIFLYIIVQDKDLDEEIAFN